MFTDPWGLAITKEDKEAYNSGRMSQYAYNLLVEATNEWNNADPNDYTALARARQKAVEARRSYNPNYVDDFDYTFGTGASVIDDGSAGLFMQTATITSSDGNTSALLRITYKRIIKNDRSYLQVVSACGYSIGSEEKNIYATRIDVSIAQSSGLLPDKKDKTFNSSTFYLMSEFNSSIWDDKKAGVMVDGCYAKFYFSNGTKMEIANNIDSISYTNEKGEMYTDADYVTIGNATDFIMTRKERLER